MRSPQSPLTYRNAGEGFFTITGPLVAKLVETDLMFIMLLGWRSGNGVLGDPKSGNTVGVRIHREEWLDYIRCGGKEVHRQEIELLDQISALPIGEGLTFVEPKGEA